MTDLTITAANVKAGADAVIDRVHNAAVAITAGQQVFLNFTTKKWGLADSDSATAEVRQTKGTALHSAAADQPLAVQTDGDITIGATLTPGLAYYLSNTPGGICPVGDVGTGEYVGLIGLAESATVLRLDYQYMGVAN